MKKYSLFVGIDISKSKLDISVLSEPDQKKNDHFIVTNNSKGIGELLQVLKKRQPDLSTMLFCFENTGVYGMPLTFYLSKIKADFWVVPAIEIKRSKGISRGKTDKSDARDIAFYAVTNFRKLKLYQLPEADILKLHLLLSQREKLLKCIHILSMNEENNIFLPKEITREIKSTNSSTIKKLKQSMKQVEDKMTAIIKSNETIKKQYSLATSVPGIGRQTAITFIVATRCFSSFENWRKMACYAGIAPFKYTSGTTIKGRTKVHPMANKKLKSMLNLCALSAKKCDTEIKLYYNKKVAEGKNKMSVLNAIRCKVLSRLFATVNRGTPYVNTQKFAA